MGTKIWARLEGGTVAELLTIDAALIPGEHIPAGWTDDVTAVAGIAVGWVKGPGPVYAAPPIDVAPLKLARLGALQAACRSAITGGYASSALGAPHWYGSKETDQMNLDADMMAAASGGSSVTAAITCSPDGGATWLPATHSAAQIGVLWADFRAWRIACQDKRRALQAAVASAATAEAVAAVAWA